MRMEFLQHRQLKSHHNNGIARRSVLRVTSRYPLYISCSLTHSVSLPCTYMPACPSSNQGIRQHVHLSRSFVTPWPFCLSLHGFRPTALPGPSLSTCNTMRISVLTRNKVRDWRAAETYSEDVACALWMREGDWCGSVNIGKIACWVGC